MAKYSLDITLAPDMDLISDGDTLDQLLDNAVVIHLTSDGYFVRESGPTDETDIAVTDWFILNSTGLDFKNSFRASPLRLVK